MLDCDVCQHLWEAIQAFENYPFIDECEKDDTYKFEYNNICYIPLIGVIACGIPILAEQNIERQILLPDTVRADFALRCKGDSMINAGIDNGDIAFIRSQKVVENGEIAAVQITEFETEATLKKVYISENSITLVAQNPNYEPITITGSDMANVEIIGKCVAVLKDFEK